MRVSRRTVLALGGSLAALLSGIALWRSRSPAGAAPSDAAHRAMERVVDHNGWMLTAADKKKILGSQPSAPATPPSDGGVKTLPPRDADSDADAP
jgi:hypothetical protein